MHKPFAIFDMDGTLVDSMGYWRRLGREYLERKKIITPIVPSQSSQKDTTKNILHAISQKNESPSFGDTSYSNSEYINEILDRIKTMTMSESAALFAQEFGLADAPQDVENEMNDMIHQHYCLDIPLKPGVQKYLKKLHDAGVKMCVASATAEPLIKACLTRLGVAEYFSFFLSCETVGVGKSQPDVFFEAARLLGAKPNEIAVYEDALYAIRTAKDAGFYTVAVYDASSEKDWDELINLADESIRGWKNMKTALTIAGSDCSGGAGIQADLKTMTMNGVYAMSAITALTAQNTTGVTGILEVTPDFLKQQIDMIFTDIRPDAVKIGMVSNSALIETIAECLTKYQAKNIVVDPVMVATSGSTLIESGAVTTLKKKLLPVATLITPNIPEAEVLSGLKIENKENMVEAAKLMNQNYGCAVLLKGGHSINDANDLLYANGQLKWFYGKRIDNPNTHGTGCTLSSAIASNLAKNYDLVNAIQRAKDYISGALAAMLDFGKGSGPLNHTFDLQGKFAQEAE